MWSRLRLCDVLPVLRASKRDLGRNDTIMLSSFVPLSKRVEDLLSSLIMPLYEPEYLRHSSPIFAGFAEVVNGGNM